MKDMIRRQPVQSLALVQRTAAFSFPSCTWERLLLLAKFYFALTSFIAPKIGNGIASASTFPSATWERGKTDAFKNILLATSSLPVKVTAV
ncbi:MAG: hypothetical protein LV480_00980 [Methylacidiphilales bacterium]|nr:hypothetical protein [Candidatus Methylacidiphilales bacterium]